MPRKCIATSSAAKNPTLTTRKKTPAPLLSRPQAILAALKVGITDPVAITKWIDDNHGIVSGVEQVACLAKHIQEQQKSGGERKQEHENVINAVVDWVTTENGKLQIWATDAGNQLWKFNLTLASSDAEDIKGYLEEEFIDD